MANSVNAFHARSSAPQSTGGFYKYPGKLRSLKNCSFDGVEGLPQDNPLPPIVISRPLVDDPPNESSRNEDLERLKALETAKKKRMRQQRRREAQELALRQKLLFLSQKRHQSTQTDENPNYRMDMDDIKVFRDWATTTVDPLMKALRKALMVNKPESIELFCEAFCTSIMEEKPEPETILRNPVVAPTKKYKALAKRPPRRDVNAESDAQLPNT